MDGEPLRILLICPDSTQARRLRALLDDDPSGVFQVESFERVKEAQEFLMCGHADAILLDLGTAASRGLALLRETLWSLPGLPHVVVAGRDYEDLAIHALHLGAQDFLTRDNVSRPLLVRSLRYAIERHRIQAALQGLSLVDDLTGLFNRRGFFALAEQQFRLLRRGGSALLAFADLDDLKSINDAFGHLEGNRALMEVAQVLRECFRQSDILARFGGDEFCALITDVQQGAIERVRRRIGQKLDAVNARSGRRHRLSLSLGIVVVTNAQIPLEDWLARADALMYDEKRARQGRVPAAVLSRQARTG
ncbi:MAG: diguanylate cyclase domain-containing protein [Candidatus Acidiferrales bacterium]